MGAGVPGASNRRPGVAALSEGDRLGPEPELIELAFWAAWRWAGRRRSLLVTASPGTAVKRLPPSQSSQATVAPSSRSNPGRQSTPTARGPVPPPRGTLSARLVEEAWRPGVHLLRLPPVYSATEVVLAAAEHGPVVVVAPTTARAAAGCAALRNRGRRRGSAPRGLGAGAGRRPGGDWYSGGRLAPCPGVVALVVLDAHDEGLVQETAPTWDAPAVAAERARRAGVPCFWVTPCPRWSYGGGRRAQLASRASERAGWAALQVVDRRDDDPRQGLYSSALVDILRSRQRVICVLNRKGRASLSICGACGVPATCEQCGSAVALVGEEFVCPRCRLQRPIVCASCGSDRPRQFRVGVSRAREQLEALAGRPVGEVVGGTRQLPEAPVLVGTEAVLYRDGELRRSGPVGAVVFVEFDQELLAPRYRAGEEALALLSRASRIVGGRQYGGRVLVQTRVPGHPVVEAALLADPGRLLMSEEPVRKALRLPPFGALALLSGPGAAEMAGLLEKQGADHGHLGGAGEPVTNGWRSSPGLGHDTGSSGPTGAAAIELNKLAEDRWVVRAPDHGTLADALERPAGQRGACV